MPALYFLISRNARSVRTFTSTKRTPFDFDIIDEKLRTITNKAY